MEPISAVALSIALGAAETGGKKLVSEVVKDAYARLKDLLKKRYPKLSLGRLEEAPTSKHDRALVEEELTAAGAAQDGEVLAAAHTLIDLVRQHSPAAASAIGVDLKDVDAANVRLADITSAGTGVKMERATLSGDIDIRGIRAGVPPAEKPKGD
jgi:hypothetical protein